MITDLGNGLGLTGSEAPWWFGLAVLLLSTAGAVARWASKRSTRPQGERVGRLEQRLGLEATRREEVEAILARMGVPIPDWPHNEHPLPRPRPRVDDDLDDRPETTELPTQHFTEHRLRRTP